MLSVVLLPDPEKAVAPPPPTDEVPKPVAPEPAAKAEPEASGASMWPSIIGLLAGAGAIWVGMEAEDVLVNQLTVFVLACFVGWQVVWNVTAALHTPLMSVTNAISGIIIVGGLLQTGVSDPLVSPAAMLGAGAILVASINIAGGFLVTQRMLAMFRK